MSARVWIATGVIVVCWAMPGQVQAQNLFQGLFAPEVGDTARTRIDGWGTADIGWDRITYDSTLFGALPDPLSYNGGSFGTSGGVTMWHRWKRISVAATGGGYFRMYRALPDQSFPAFFGLARWQVPISQRFTFRFDQNVNYSRYYAYNRTVLVDSDQGSVLPPQYTFFAERRANVTYSLGTDAEYRLSERSSITGTLRGRRVDYTDNSPDLSSGVIGIRFNHRLTEYATLRLGYAFSTWEYPQYRTTLITNDINAGVSYSRPLAESRSTRIGFDVYTAVVDNYDNNQFRLNGSAFIAHALSRSWVVSAMYHRGNEVVEGFALPFFSFYDTVGAGISGLLGRRFVLSGSMGYSLTHYEVQQVTNRSQWLDWVGTLHASLFKGLAGYMQVGTGQYDFDRRIGLLKSTPLSNSQYWFRVGVLMRMPLLIK